MGLLSFTKINTMCLDFVNFVLLHNIVFFFLIYEQKSCFCTNVQYKTLTCIKTGAASVPQA